ncbi:MAG: sugar phosphate isomerase/epimerase [Planctomycetia bacterium]|nr:sugar phosphate isomerase/epimerase [Planctomycetia bacterium]
MTNPHADIRIGTVVPAHARTADVVRQLLTCGFESFQIVFGRSVGDLDLADLAAAVRRELDAHAPADGVAARMSAIGAYGNPLTSPEAVHDWERLIDAAAAFGCDVVSGFAGRVPGRPVPESYGRFGEVFRPLAARAADRGVRLAFENCEKRGTWESGDHNIAHAPQAWEAMFAEVESPVIGLEWEPCHQLMSLVDPLPQLRRYAHRIWHIHGKDATVLWDVIRTHGIRGGVPYAFHRTPGFGDTNWTDLISTLRMAGWRGSIDIEGFHDPVYRDALETTGQVAALEHLQRCRGGRFVPNVF